VSLRVVPRAAGQRMRWKNGAGWTTEIARRDAADGAFDWRISVAEVDADSDFSPFPGCDRTLLVLDGEGIELRVDGHEPALLGPRSGPHAFSGDAPARCRVLDGPTRDFNVITRRSAFAHKVMFRPLVGPMLLLAEPGTTWIAHLVAGRAARQHVDDLALSPGDTLLLESDGNEREQLVISGGGEIVLAQLVPVR
jgi:environmental stress-induced protein Ves